MAEVAVDAIELGDLPVEGVEFTAAGGIVDLGEELVEVKGEDRLDASRHGEKVVQLAQQGSALMLEIGRAHV